MSAACIELQDGFDADAEVALFALWCASRGVRLDMDTMMTADAAVSEWRDTVVRPIRRARRALKPPPGEPFDPVRAEALRQQLLDVELAAEREQHRAMEGFAPDRGTAGPTSSARANLRKFAALSGIPRDTAALAVLLRAFA